MILIVSDQDYYDKSLILIKSIRLLYPDLKIHYHQINFKLDLKIDNIEYSYNNLELDNNKKFKYNNIQYTQKQAYCANIRFQIINNLISENQYILYLDADSIIRKPIDSLLQLCQNYDLVINKCTKKSYYRKGFRLRTGVFSIRNTPIMKKFLNNILQNIKLEQWFSDQDTIQDTFIEYVDDISFKILEQKYIDWNYNQESEIWVGKGDNKYKNLQYKQLENYINTLYENIIN
jgi:hypothetical protein